MDKKEQIKRALEAHFDIESDLKYLITFSAWVIENYFDQSVIPLPKIGDTYIDLRMALLESAVIKYRRCFDGAQRGRIDVEKGKQKIEPWISIHDGELIRRANHLVAHPVLAAHSATLYIAPDRTISAFIQRPGVNKFDFENVRKLSSLWLEFVQEEISRLQSELKPLLTLDDISTPHFHLAPFGSDIDIQQQRTKYPAGS